MSPHSWRKSAESRSVESQVFKSKPARYSAQFYITISSHGILIPSNSASKAGSFDRFVHRLEASDALTSNYRGYATNADLILLGSSNLKKKKFQTPRNPEGEDGRGEKGGEKHPFPPSLLLLFRPGYRPPLGLAPAVSPTQVSSECLRPRPGSRFQRINNWGRVQPPLKTYTSLVHVESPLRGIFKKKRKKSRKATRFSGMDRVLEAKEGRRKARWSQFRVRSNHRRLNRDGAFLERGRKTIVGTRRGINDLGTCHCPHLGAEGIPINN